MCIKVHNPSQAVLPCHSFSTNFRSSLNFFFCQWRSNSSSFQVYISDMETQTAREPLTGTNGALSQQGTGSLRLKAYTKWNYLARLWTETITEFRSDMESTNWGRTAAITFYLSICCTWAGVLVFTCIFIPLMSLNFDGSNNYCAPDGSFRLESFSPLAPTWFFQVVLGFGSLNFTAVKTIDIVWDVVSDFHHIKF